MKLQAILTTANASSYEPVVFEVLDGSDTDTTPERVVRVPTIDGSAVLYSLGKSDADRTISITFNSDIETVNLIDEMRNGYTDFCLSLHHGVYSGMIQDVSSDKLTFLVGAKL
jgi:hypothetical protein